MARPLNQLLLFFSRSAALFGAGECQQVNSLSNIRKHFCQKIFEGCDRKKSFIGENQSEFGDTFYYKRRILSKGLEFDSKKRCYLGIKVFENSEDTFKILDQR